jgi:hypothetical protein
MAGNTIHGHVRFGSPNRKALRHVGDLDEETSERVMAVFVRLLAV